uniref:VWFA domain-containing protein n=1 Tax=Steinernema glaseri TaxID=37863 RepID=A0A1I8A3F7_9BILA
MKRLIVSAPLLVALLVLQCTNASEFHVATDRTASKNQKEIHSSSVTTGSTTPMDIGRQCDGNFQDAWLDIVVLIDSTRGVGVDGFRGAKAIMWGYLSQLTISTGAGRHTRLALINLGSTAHVVASLDDLPSTAAAILAFDGMPYLGDPVINHEAGLIKARELFGQAQRRDVPKLAILVTSREEHCPEEIITEGFESACRAAASLKTIATLLTVSLVYHDNPIPPLTSLASPCFATTNQDPNLDQLIVSANCFCEGDRWHQFQHGCVRYDSCIYLHENITGYDSAQHACSSKPQQRLVSIDRPEKNVFVNDLASIYKAESFWIGLKMSTSTNGVWDHGYVFNFGQDYSAFRAQPEGDTCTLSTKEGWTSQPCTANTDAKKFVCEKKACSVNNFCG